MKHPFITLTSDFGVQSQGVGIMEAVAREISPDAHIIHLMHGLPDFDITSAARTMETLNDVPVGFHVCVVDPGVGTKQKAIIIETGRGDFLIGPDNGVLIPATRFLGGIKKTVEITNETYMKHPVSPIFHGRSIFAPAAAHLSVGVSINEFGKEVKADQLAEAPYEEAVVENNAIKAQVIHINKYGSLHLNIQHAAWDAFSTGKKQTGKKQHVTLAFGKQSLTVPVGETFGDVEEGKPLILKDDYGRVEVAINMGNFAEAHKIRVGDTCVITKLLSH